MTGSEIAAAPASTAWPRSVTALSSTIASTSPARPDSAMKPETTAPPIELPTSTMPVAPRVPAYSTAASTSGHSVLP